MLDDANKEGTLGKKVQVSREVSLLPKRINYLNNMLSVRSMEPFKLCSAVLRLGIDQGRRQSQAEADGIKIGTWATIDKTLVSSRTQRMCLLATQGV